MKSRKRTIIILIVVIVILFGFVGSLLIYRNKLSSEKTKNDIPFISSAPSGISIKNFYDKPITDEKIALESIEANRDKLGYVDKNFTFIYDEEDCSETAYHFDLYYKGLPVHSPAGIRGVSVITHLDNSAKILISGVSNSEEIRKVNTIPKITQDEAKEIAKSTMNMNSYVDLKLVLYEVKDTYVLAYYYRGSKVCIINAENGEVITCRSTIMSSTGEFTGQNGDIHQVFYDDYKDENHDIKNALWNKEKNIFIHDNITIEHGNITIEEVKNKDKVITIDNLQSGKNKSAIDGMANTYRAVEYFEKHFDIKFDSTVVSVNVDMWKDENNNVITDNAGGGYIDKDGEKVAFLIFPFASDKKKPQYSAYLDIVAHEYTHAVTNEKFDLDEDSSDSRYYERNALSEAYCDIFGELIEKEYTGQTDWKISSIRNLAKKEKNTRFRYKYSNQYTGTGANYYNSTIISHTAYLMSRGNDSNKYDAEFLLEYNQLGQLWFGSLEYLKKSEFKDFADCRYAVEESARDLIKKGILVEGNLKIIQQAFNEVGVNSNPARRGAIDSAEIKMKHKVEDSIEETNSTEMVEIEEIEITLDNIDNYFSTDYTNIDFLEFNNLFLACQYEKPSEIDLNTILYHGLGTLSNDITSEERETLNNYFDSDIIEKVGLTKISESELNDYLKNKIGLKLGEFNGALNYIYVEKYKAYYRYHKTDTILIPESDLNFKNVEKTDDNLYKVVYTRDSEKNIEYEVKFKVVNGVLQFLSNKEKNIETTDGTKISTGLINSWQNLYSKYLLNGEYKKLGTGFANGGTGEEYTLTDEDAKYQLAYIDNDDIPELIISGGYSVHIFTVKDNELIQLKKNDNNGNFSWYGCLHYREKEGLFLDSYQRMGAYRTPVYKLQNGECLLQANIEYYESVESGEIINQSFIINDEEVSLDDYVNELKKWKLNTYFTEQHPEYNIENDNWKILYDSDGYEITESNINIINNLKSENNEQNKGTVSIEDGYLNVRESPSTKGKIIGRLYNSDEIIIEETSKDNKWLKVFKGDIKGYVSKEYIKVKE